MWVINVRKFKRFLMVAGVIIASLAVLALTIAAWKADFFLGVFVTGVVGVIMILFSKAIDAED